MSVSVQQILGFLRAVAPQELALDWDNVGLLVDAGQPVDGVLTTLSLLLYYLLFLSVLKWALQAFCWQTRWQI